MTLGQARGRSLEQAQKSLETCRQALRSEDYEDLTDTDRLTVAIAELADAVEWILKAQR